MIRLHNPSGCHQVGRPLKRDPMLVFVSSALALAMLAAAVLVAVL